MDLAATALVRRAGEGSALPTNPDPALPSTVAVTHRAAVRLRAGHLWVYRSELLPQQQPGPGELVTVTDPRGLPLGSALHSPASEIALRLVSTQPGLTRPELTELFGERLRQALQLREELCPLSPANNARRLVFSEADGLPGIVADQYADVIVVQLLTQPMATGEVRQLLAETLPAAFAAGSGGTVWERPDHRIRELEQISEPVPGGPLALRSGEAGSLPEPRSETVFTLNGLSFGFSAAAGQKTGAFLDQRLNYAAAAAHAHGRALDLCTYQGGFALHLARRCEHVTGVDASRAALEMADRNLDLNREGGTLDPRAEVDWIEADAFDLLRAYEAAGERFDTVVLDPPAFAKSRRAAASAARGYRELNLRALRLLRPGGTLVTCSCSHHVPLPEFTGIVAEAAADARRRVQLLEVRGAAPDHPAILTLPETSYLKCLVCRVE